MERRLKDISLHLLDLGKRNRLINYKQTGFRTIEVLNADFFDLFEKVTNGNTLKVFDIDSVLNRYNTTIDGTFTSLEEYSIGKVKDICLPVLKTNEVLCYKQGTKLNKILKVIHKEFNNTLIEKGLNTLYLTFGMIEYYEKEENYLAPLLLIPVQISLNEGRYTLKEYDDEVIVNPTLAYLLKYQYKIDLLEFNEDDNLTDYILKIKKSLEERKLNYYNRISLGIYSFLKMNMFNDLNNNTSIVLENKNILRLLDQPIEPEELKKEDIRLVVDADASQVAAIEYAMAGASFVLQGPPGSGKSQTITNIIASAIGSGKKVLFVSEKQAALNIVYENLRKAGLESFALELHSHKANKKEFIDELYKTAVSPKYDISNDAFNVEQKKFYLESKLSDYRKELHQVIDRLNISLYDVFSHYLSLAKPQVNYRINNINVLKYTYLDQVKDQLDEYSVLSNQLGYDYHDGPLFGYKARDLNYLRYDALADLDRLLAFYKYNVNIKQKIIDKLPLLIDNYQDLIESVQYLEAFTELKLFTSDYFNKQRRYELTKNIEKYLKSKNFIRDSRLKNFLDLKILDVDVNKLTNDFAIASSSIMKYLSPKYYKQKKYLKSFMKLKMSDSDLIKKLEEAINYKQVLADIDDSFDKLPHPYQDYEYELMLEDLEHLKVYNFDLNLNENSFKLLKKEFVDILISYRYDSSINLNDYQKLFDLEVINLPNTSLELIASKLENIVSNASLLELHARRLNLIDNLDENILGYLNKALALKLPLKNLSSDFEALFYEANIYYEIENSLILKEFSGLGIDKLITEFKNYDSLYLEANKAAIVSKLSKLRPDDSIMAGSKFAILVKEHNKSRRHKPIRLLLDEIFELVLDIKPVFLMSPLSVSTYLSAKTDIFDLVIFDEASQVFAWDALGAIYRAKQCIVIGDSKQMPPSNFFTALSGDDDFDNYENDLESILDKASSVFMTKQLNWHYRSRSEELIAFSNKEFYDSRLITIPQAKAHEPYFGIDFHYLSEGIYEAKTRVNVTEANYIVDLVFKHFDKLPNQSLGVVAFSNAQAELISDLIEKELDNRPDYRHYFDSNKNEPFFVKNLETVQGDERDAIIFSICYAKNKEGKFYQHFGPLNNLGGERRLNVAITRAKYNVSVVSSIKASDIRLDSTESIGVKLLKEYLDYAENITTPHKVLEENKDGIINSVANFLTAEGFLVEKNIGTSAFKIDIAVLHPLTKEYFVAIMLDGNAYRLGNVTDANRLQELLLTRLGWQFYRLFSTLWINSFKIESEKLINFINEAFTNNSKIIKDEPKESFLVEDEEELSDSFVEYEELTNLETLYKNKSIKAIIKMLVQKEEPIHKEYLLKRICNLYGKTKVTNIVREEFEKDIKDLDLIFENNFYSTKYYSELPLRINSSRIIDYVHPLELQDAIYQVVKRSNGIEKEGCFKAVIKLLGYSRMSDNSLKLLEDALVFLKIAGKVVEKNACLYV